MPLRPDSNAPTDTGSLVGPAPDVRRGEEVATFAPPAPSLCVSLVTRHGQLDVVTSGPTTSRRPDSNRGPLHYE